MMFDFERAEPKTLTETIKVMAGLSRIIIADVTNKSAPLELQATVPDYMVPFVPLLETGEEPFSMLKDLQQYDWVMPVIKYRSIDQLVEKLETKIIRPAVLASPQAAAEKSSGNSDGVVGRLTCSPANCRKRMAERWAKMTREERKRYRQSWRGRWCPRTRRRTPDFFRSVSLSMANC